MRVEESALRKYDVYDGPLLLKVSETPFATPPLVHHPRRRCHWAMSGTIGSMGAYMLEGLGALDKRIATRPAYLHSIRWSMKAEMSRSWTYGGGRKEFCDRLRQ